MSNYTAADAAKEILYGQMWADEVQGNIEGDLSLAGLIASAAQNHEVEDKVREFEGNLFAIIQRAIDAAKPKAEKIKQLAADNIALIERAMQAEKDYDTWHKKALTLAKELGESNATIERLTKERDEAMKLAVTLKGREFADVTLPDGRIVKFCTPETRQAIDGLKAEVARLTKRWARTKAHLGEMNMRHAEAMDEVRRLTGVLEEIARSGMDDLWEVKRAQAALAPREDAEEAKACR